MVKKYKTSFTLRQHTPLVHFQWHENDATIRPSEMKAKLDKWLIANVSKKIHADASASLRLEIAKAHPTLNKWLKGVNDHHKSNPALNYSIHITPIGSNILEKDLNTRIVKKEKYDDRTGENVEYNQVEDKDYPPYFGNQLNEAEMVSGTKKIKRLVLRRGALINISSPFADLIAAIDDNFFDFVLKTNFGTRQGKGFGSFLIEKKGDGTSLFQDLNKKFEWKLDVVAGGTHESEIMSSLFKNIELFYRTLRSGINLKDRSGNGLIYFKSIMFQYLKDEINQQWDKKSIKQIFFKNNRTELPINNRSTPENEDVQKQRHSDNQNLPIDPGSPIFWEPKSDTKYLWRDLLGLSTIQQWKNYRRPGGHPDINLFKMHLPDSDQQEITRFKSPIFFKPLRVDHNKFRVYIEIPKHIKDSFSDPSQRSAVEEAEILSKEIKIDTSLPTINSKGLPFPDTFDFNAFMEFVSSCHPSSQVKDLSQHESRVYKDLLKLKLRKS